MFIVACMYLVTGMSGVFCMSSLICMPGVPTVSSVRCVRRLVPTVHCYPPRLRTTMPA